MPINADSIAIFTFISYRILNVHCAVLHMAFNKRIYVSVNIRINGVDYTNNVMNQKGRLNYAATTSWAFRNEMKTDR